MGGMKPKNVLAMVSPMRRGIDGLAARRKRVLGVLDDAAIGRPRIHADGGINCW